jgi:SAM-dependent methyltransferase
MSENSQLTTGQLKRRIEATLERKSTFPEALSDAGISDANRNVAVSQTSSGLGQTSPPYSSQSNLHMIKNFVNRIPVIGSLLRWTARVVLMPVRFHQLQTTASRRFKELYAQQAALKSEITFLQAHLLELRDKYEGQLDGFDARLDQFAVEAQTRASYISAMNDQLQGLEGRSGQLETRANTFDVNLEGIKVDTANLASEISTLYQRVLAYSDLPEFIGPLPKTFGPGGLETGYEALDEFMQAHETFSSEADEREQLYNAIEIVLRGSEDLIAQRQSLYLPTLENYKVIDTHPILDIGCGRGEFLKLLQERGHKAIGIEVNLTLVDRLQSKGLEVYAADALEYLDSVPDNSLGGITAFQVVEHLDHDYVKQLLKTSVLKLAEGGFVLFETPNPYCLGMYRNYYLDPTHFPPVPKDLLSILMRFYGFKDIRVFFQSPLPVRGDKQMGDWAYYLDYAILGQKIPS